MALKTITSGHRDLQRISIDISYDVTLIADPTDVRQTVVEEICGEWMELDRLLVHFWESCAIRAKITYKTEEWEKEVARGYMGSLLPETTARGIVELVNLREQETH